MYGLPIAAAASAQVCWMRPRLVAGKGGWKRLEVTTPPLSLFERSLSFYTREGFSITGGRKLKLALAE
jgi:hypothetical protein